MPTSDGTQACTYTLIENRIHQFVFHVYTREGIDQFVNKMREIHLSFAPDVKVFHVLLDMRQPGMPPIQYGFSKVQSLLKEFPDRPATRTAFILDNQIYVMLLQSFGRIALRRGDDVRYFLPNQQDEAVAWLMSAY